MPHIFREVVNCILVTLLGIGLGSIQKDAEATPFLEVLGAIVCIVFFAAGTCTKLNNTKEQTKLTIANGKEG